jgi:hypothetical protein
MANKKRRFERRFLFSEAIDFQEPTGMPVGRTQPMYQLSRMNKNSATDRPTRSAKARAICLCRPSSRVPLRSMNTPALARAPKTAINSNTITIFIRAVYASGAAQWH